MTTARQHYKRLLGPVYRWSVAVHGDPFARGRAQLDELDLLDGESYLDLGAGFGAHSIPLARSGKSVTAVDFDPHLLEQLEKTARDEGRRIEAHAGDILEFLEGARGRRWDVVVCLGDTLTHLASIEDVERLLELVSSRLKPAGRFAVGHRDSAQLALAGLDRFIPVGRDAERTMHCLLEPVDDRHLRVTDMVTEIEADGLRTRLSEYIKLRIARDELVRWAAAARMTAERQMTERGMTYSVFRSST